MKLDGSAPTLLFGYGAANARERPNWSPLLVPWVERGGIYAFAGIRGGGEYGEGWHRAGSCDRPLRSG
jgi:prolyl oligopeptidase